MKVYEGTDAFQLLMQAQEALGFNQKDLAELMGRSRRTLSRYVRSRSAILIPQEWLALARAVYAKNPSLAATLASRAGGTLVSFGIAPPPPPPAPPKPAEASTSLAAPTRDQLDLVVLAAAEAANLAPQAVRPVIAAAFARAAAMGVTVEGVSRAMAPVKAKKSSS